METIEMMSSPLHDETQEFGLEAISSNMDREESDRKVDIMQINLSSMKDTMESMKHKVDTIETSVESMKHKVDTIEKTMKVKVDTIEKSMYAVVSKMDAVTESVIKLTEQLSKNFDKK